MFILFDSNVWISQMGLQSKNGAAVRYFARKQGATVVIPEVVQLEVEEILTQSLLKNKREIEEGYDKLLPVLGELQSVHLPSDDEIRKIVANIIPDFDVPTRHIPFNIDAARSSMMKLLRRIPPSKSKEQFRDGVIWAHCLELLSEGDVYLVSEDKCFYEKNDYTKGLASELIEEMQQRSESHHVELRRSLKELLHDIRMPTRLDNGELFKSIQTQESETIEELLISHGFELCGGVAGNVDCYGTEEAQRVYFQFNFTHPCQDSTGAGRRQGKLKLKGSGFLNPETKEINEVQLSNILLDYPDWEWQEGGPSRGAVFLSMHFNAPKVHRIKFPLDPPETDPSDPVP